MQFVAMLFSKTIHTRELVCSSRPVASVRAAHDVNINAKRVCDDDSTSHFVDSLNIKLLTTTYTIFCQCCPFPHQCNFVRARVNHRVGVDVWGMR